MHWYDFRPNLWHASFFLPFFFLQHGKKTFIDKKEHSSTSKKTIIVTHVFQKKIHASFTHLLRMYANEMIFNQKHTYKCFKFVSVPYSICKSIHINLPNFESNYTFINGNWSSHSLFISTLHFLLLVKKYTRFQY